MYPVLSKKAGFIALQDFSVQGKERRRGCRFFEGWQVGVLYGAAIAFVVLILNVGLLA